MKLKPHLLAALCLAGVSPVIAESFYKDPVLFSTRPQETKSLQTIDRFGPVGMGIDLLLPPFTMRIKNIEEGSPAATAGKLEKGQIIESINGESLRDIDPRVQLANILAKAEATDGVLKFKIKDLAEAVEVNVPVLGAYSDTWPMDCPKSDKIVRGLADYIADPEGVRGIGDIDMIFLLSTGDKKDEAVVGEWARTMKPHTYAWFLGFGGIPLCEYYLRTGDKEVLANIQTAVDNALAGQYNDAWAGRGVAPSVTYGNGHLNAGGTAVLTFLLLAKECGADVPDDALLGALRHFYRYAGKGGNPYGDNRPEVGFVDNGKNGNLAFAMAAAASLTPEGEDSLYADARDTAAMTSFYTTSFMLHGHTGGGIGEIWRSGSMGLLREKKPKQYRDFMDNRRWHYELSRRFDGSFGILGGGGYDKEQWGVAYGWAYTVPRQKLRIFGAPPTKFSKPYQLPKQPWGTEADNEFVSLKAVPYANGEQQDLSGETLANDASIPYLGKIHAMDASDEVVRKHIHHQDAVIRELAAAKAIGVNLGYIGWEAPGGKARPELMMEFLQSPSARVRRAMFSQVARNLKDGGTPPMQREVFDLAVKAVADPAESWWVKDAALHVIGHGQTDWVVPQVDLLISYLDHSEWWLQNAAMTALTPVVADERTYQKVLPAIAELVRTHARPALTLGLLPPIREQLRAASPEVQQLAVETLRETYTGYEGVTQAPGGLDLAHHYRSHLEYIAASLVDVPGGLDVLYDISRERFPEQVLPYKEFFLNADPKQFGPKLKAAITPIIENELIPQYVGENRKSLRQLAAAEIQSPRCGADSIDELAGLHARAGNDEYAWLPFTKVRTDDWSYFSFDPIPAEQVPFDQLVTRYREVTPPQGMENWFGTDFDSDKAGWSLGKAPFGNYLGKIPQGPVSKCSDACNDLICYGAEKANTLWEKEVLLLRKKVAVPPLKDGHRYRLRVYHRAHVGNGGGYGIWVNGKLLIENPKCIGRGGGEKPYGAYITEEWLDEFAKGEVTIAVKSFLRDGDKYKTKPTEPVPQGLISIDIEEQKLPPIGDDLVRESAKFVPMLSTEWQNALFSDSEEDRANAPLFHWDGSFVPNTGLMGTWEIVSTVAQIKEFDPAKPTKRGKFPFESITLKNGGLTSDPLFIWSGDHLMDLDRYQAMRMQAKTIDGSDYLFIEQGGYGTRNKPGWTSPWMVLTRQ